MEKKTKIIIGVGVGLVSALGVFMLINYLPKKLSERKNETDLKTVDLEVQSKSQKNTEDMRKVKDLQRKLSIKKARREENAEKAKIAQAELDKVNTDREVSRPRTRGFING